MRLGRDDLDYHWHTIRFDVYNSAALLRPAAARMFPGVPYAGLAIHVDYTLQKSLDPIIEPIRIQELEKFRNEGTEQHYVPPGAWDGVRDGKSTIVTCSFKLGLKTKVLLMTIPSAWSTPSWVTKISSQGSPTVRLLEGGFEQALFGPVASL